MSELKVGSRVRTKASYTDGAPFGRPGGVGTLILMSPYDDLVTVKFDDWQGGWGKDNSCWTIDPKYLDLIVEEITETFNDWKASDAVGKFYVFDQDEIEYSLAFDTLEAAEEEAAEEARDSDATFVVMKHVSEVSLGKVDIKRLT